MWVGKYEVTQAEYNAIVGFNPSKFKNSRRPVEQVSWNDAQSFVQKLNQRDSHLLPAGLIYRLPTAGEWKHYSGKYDWIGDKWAKSDRGGAVDSISLKRAQTEVVGSLEPNSSRLQ